MAYVSDLFNQTVSTKVLANSSSVMRGLLCRVIIRFLSRDTIFVFRIILWVRPAYVDLFSFKPHPCLLRIEWYAPIPRLVWACRVYSVYSHRRELCGMTHLLCQCPVYRPSIWEALSRMPRLLHRT